MKERILTAADLKVPALHQAMGAAFSDYLVPMQQTETMFRNMLQQRGFDPHRSLVAVDGEGPVGFWHLGFDPEKPGVAYVIATGVVPRARRLGVAGRLFAALRRRLDRDAIQRVRLEVIDGNRAAFALYEKLGFAQRRYLACFKTADGIPAVPSAVTVRPLDRDRALVQGAAFGSCRPSWQNSATSVRQTVAPVVSLGAYQGNALVGVVVGTPKTGQVMQLAVAPAHRRQGVGQTLLHAFTASVASTLVALNIDTQDPTSLRFCERQMGPAFLHQHEMEYAGMP
jgi:ribosomal protein S18 acetylase RimI-like enzyme